MKNLTNKSAHQDKGIAIIFSLVMLTIFFFLAFGFLAAVSTAKSAANARSPKDKANLVASSLILTQAMRGLEATDGLLTDGNNYLTAPNTEKMLPFDFTDTTTPITFYGWGTKGGVSDATAGGVLADLVTMHLDIGVTSKDYKPDLTDTNWNNISWVQADLDSSGGNDDTYAWMVIHSDKADINYIGGDTANVLAVMHERKGYYGRELDINNLAADYAATTYIDWDSIKPWLHKKKLVKSVNLAASHETAVQSLEVGTSAIKIRNGTDPSGDPSYDLSQSDLQNNNITADTLNSAIDWIPNTTAGNQLAANIVDYIDSNTAMSTDGSTYYGNERVPYINEIGVHITNTTADGTMTASPTTMIFDFQIEFVDMYNVDHATGWGTPDGSAALFKVYFSATGNRDGTAFTINDHVSSPLTSSSFNLLTATWTGGYTSTVTGATASLQDSTALTASETLTDLVVTITKIELYGDASTLWDVAKLPVLLTDTWSAGEEKGLSIECSDPRLNQDSSTWESSATAYLGTSSTTPRVLGDFAGDTENTINLNYIYGSTTAVNSLYDQEKLNDGDSVEPYNTSTAYMPSGGGITTVEELGYIHRGFIGQTLNMADYNVDASTTFQATAAKRQPGHSGSGTATDLKSVNSTFTAGDRSLLDYVTIGTPSYSQYGAINPNSSDQNTLTLLLKDCHPTFGPYSPAEYNGTVDGSKYVITALDDVSEIISKFPLYFEMDDIANNSGSGDATHQFNFTEFDSEYTHNPKTLGHIVNIAPSDLFLSDTQREAIILKNYRLLSTRYSYFTILGAVNLNAGATFSSLYAFVRRDNETGKVTIIRKSVK
jgi:hypothetical protein